MRMAEAHAKMHLREYVRDDDLDMAIRVMIESFIDSQKYSVQRTLQRKFRKYLVYKKHNNSLIMHILNQLVAEQQAFQQMRSDIRSRKNSANIIRCLCVWKISRLKKGKHQRAWICMLSGKSTLLVCHIVSSLLYTSRLILFVHVGTLAGFTTLTILKGLNE